jgi:hypothetical protein
LKKIFLTTTYFILICFSPVILFSQELKTDMVKDTLHINLTNEYRISSFNIIPFSEKIYINKRLLEKTEYRFLYSQSSFSLSPETKYSLLDTLIVVYKTVKLNLKREYKRRSLLVNYDNQFADTVRTLKNISEPLTTESIFGKGIQKSGALVRGFTFGTNRDLQLNSGLRLQLSGKLSDDIDIVAALTDENTPIQSEGNTETLDELDKVFIEIRHKNAVGTFGDYVLDVADNEFSKINRKLQGLKGEFMFGQTKAIIAIASSKGKFNNNRIDGQDGNQGPYRLYGINNENTIILIAGTEKVYVDGELMKRGENNDYIIDYSNSEVTFTPKKLITSASRISIDFEYTDQSFKRNFFGADFSTKIFDDKLKIGVGYFREGDDENNPIEYTFSDSDMEILRQAGSDRNKAVKSGVTLAEPDSSGKVQGVYSRVDTIINNENFTYYNYLPGNSSSIYDVSFSYVGSGYGDYVKESLGRYKFAGIKQGSYLPVIYLPMPELKQLGNFSLEANLTEGINIVGEFSGSSWDKNTFSSIDNSNNFGYARKLQFDMSPREIKLGSFSIGRVGINVKDRFIQGKYSSLDRIDQVEFNRYYNLPQQLSADQTLREFDLNYLPIEKLAFNAKYGHLKEGDNFYSDRIFSSVNFSDKKDYKLNYQLDYVNSKNITVESNWIKENGDASYTMGLFNPGLTFIYENKEERISPNDSLLLSSLKYVEVAPYLEFKNQSGIDFRMGYSMRDESFPLEGVMTKQSTTSMEQFQVNFRSLKEFSTSINFTFRDKKYADDFKNKGFTDNQTILLMSQSRFNFGEGFIVGDLYYQAATEQSAKLQKVFVKVTKGTGNYIYLGDLNNNGIADENEFQLTAYDGDYTLVTLYPIIDLKTNTRWRIDFSRGIKGDNLWAKILHPVSTETSLRIEENSNETDTKKIYLLNLSSFLNDSTTIRGSQLFQHDFNLFQNSNDFSARLRYTQRKSLNQYSGGNEKGYFRERGLRMTFRLIPEISNQTELINQTDNMISPPITNRAREVLKNSVSSDFSYRPEQNIEVGFKLESARSIDDYPAKPITVDMNSQTLRLNISFQNLGRLRIELERTELTASSESYNIPFEITRGNVIGKNYFWRAFFDYRINSFIQSSFSYDARLQGSSRVIQTMRAEAKAYF